MGTLAGGLKREGEKQGGDQRKNIELNKNQQKKQKEKIIIYKIKVSYFLFFVPINNFIYGM